MTFFSLIAALVLDQFKPLPATNPIMSSFARYAAALERWFNAGEHSHGIIAWAVAIAPLVVVTLAVYYALYALHPALAWVFNVLVLYLTMGLRQFSSPFTAIAKSLQEKDVEAAREHMAKWLDEAAYEFSDSEIARVAIERGLILSHRHVFAMIFWFVVAPGPAGAVLYRAAWSLHEQWKDSPHHGAGGFGRFASQGFEAIDWIPARLTAISFAIVGDFEDAVYCWREQAKGWFQVNQGIILASGGGALGVKLGDVLHQHGTLSFRPELGLGDDADADFMQSAVGLVWRALLLWISLILLMTVAHWVG
ncbi:MAG: CobD/CbiB family protein [Burkholderiales bacterium]